LRRALKRISPITKPPGRHGATRAGVQEIVADLPGVEGARIDASLAQFSGRPLAEPFPYVVLDACYERVREAGVIASQAVLIAIGIDWDGRRQVLAIELANRESRSSWRDFLRELKARGLHGVEFVVADDHAGLRAALRRRLARSPHIEPA